MDTNTFIQFFHNIQSLLAPLGSLFSHFGSGTATSSTATSTTSVGHALPANLRIILVDIIKVLVWGIDLVRQLLVKVEWLLS